MLRHSMPMCRCHATTRALPSRGSVTSSQLPRGGIPRTRSKTGSQEQKVQHKLRALASPAAVSLSALSPPQAFASQAFGSYGLIHFTKRSLPFPLRLVSCPAPLQPHLLEPFLSSLPLPFEITLSYEGFGSEAQICSLHCGSASRFSLILLPWLLCHAKHLGQCGCEMRLKIVICPGTRDYQSPLQLAAGRDLKVRIFQFKGT